MIPLLFGALVLVLGVRGIPLGEAERALIKQADCAEAILGKIEAVTEFILQLIRAEHQMALGDRKLTHTDEAVHFAGVLIAEQRGRFAETHRQIAVRTAAVQIDLILERAGHRAQGEALLRLILRVAEDEHAVEIVVPVAGNLVKLTLGHERRLGQKIPVRLFDVLDPALQQLNDTRALRQEDRKALADAVDRGEVFQLTAQLVVVALEGFCLFCQILIKLFLLRERNGVDSLQHLALGVAAPVCAAALRELNGVALDAACRIEVRAGTEVCKLALRVERDVRVFGQVVDQLDLIRLVLFLHILDGFLTRQLKALELQLFLADLAHLGLDGVEIFLREVERSVEVIVEAVVDRRANGQLDLRPQAFDGLRHDVGTGVPVRFTVLRVFKREFIVFGHILLPPKLIWGKTKTPYPCRFRGEALYAPRFHPAYECTASVALCLCNGRTRQRISALRLRSGIRAGRAKALAAYEPLSVMRCRCRDVSSSQPFLDATIARLRGSVNPPRTRKCVANRLFFWYHSDRITLGGQLWTFVISMKLRRCSRGTDSIFPKPRGRIF